MSSRHDESIGRMPNPSQYYLEWNSEMNSFCYYSAETEERVAFPLPFKFLALKFMNTIAGYDKVRQMSLYSNEVSDTRMEHFRVSYRDGSYIANGLYADIKDSVQAAGGRFTRSIYAMTPKGILVNIKLRGEQMINFGAIEKHGNRWRDEWLQVATSEAKTYGEQNYTVPIFGFGGGLSPQDSKKADEAYELVKAYFSSRAGQLRTTAPAPQRQSTPATATRATQEQVAGLFAPGSSDDDLPF